MTVDRVSLVLLRAEVIRDRVGSLSLIAIVLVMGEAFTYAMVVTRHGCDILDHTLCLLAILAHRAIDGLQVWQLMW